MARPREFNEEHVLDAALAVFWKHGFDGTSVEDLTRATGLVRASLYGAFGDKRALYRRVLQRYLERLEGLDALLQHGSVSAGVRRLFERWIEICSSPSGPKGCFVLLSAELDSKENGFARDLALESSRHLHESLTAALVRGQKAGEITSKTEPAMLASLVCVLLQGLATGARTGKGQPELEQAISAALTLLQR